MILCLSLAAWGQDASRVAPDAVQKETGQKRILWIIPNYRTTPTQSQFRPITWRQKFTLARQDALDPGTFLLAAAFAGRGQLTNENPSFGQGTKGYAHRFVTSYADWAIGDYMTEAVVPVIAHQDPRYFRKGTGSGWSRLGHAVGTIFWTRLDSGRGMFNFCEIGGNAAAAAISNAYYPDQRTAADTFSRMGVQVATDTLGNILKEFWPDVHQKLQRHK